MKDVYDQAEMKIAGFNWGWGGGCFLYCGGGWAGVVFNVCCGCVVLVGPKPGLV